MTLFICDVDGTLVEGFLDTTTCEACGGMGHMGMREDHTPATDDTTRCGACKGKGQLFGATRPYGDVTVLPRRAEVLRTLARNGHSFALATNQGGIALGYQTREEVGDKLARVCAAFDFFYGARFSVHYAPGHPAAKDPALATPFELHRRKPNPGMIEEALVAHFTDQAALDEAWQQAVYVGDLATDRDAAAAARISFAWAEDFFRDGYLGEASERSGAHRGHAGGGRRD